MRVLVSWCVLLVASGCAPAPVTGQQLVGRWEFEAAINRTGQIVPAWMRLTLFIVGMRADSLHGGANVYLDINEPLDDRPCGVLRGAFTDQEHLSLVIMTIDDPGADMVIDARVRNDSMLVHSMRPRDGQNVLGQGVSLVFLRKSKDPAGCLTRG